MIKQTRKVEFDYDDVATPKEIIAFLEGLPQDVHIVIKTWDHMQGNVQDVHSIAFDSEENTVEFQ